MPNIMHSYSNDITIGQANDLANNIEQEINSKKKRLLKKKGNTYYSDKLLSNDRYSDFNLTDFDIKTTNIMIEISKGVVFALNNKDNNTVTDI